MIVYVARCSSTGKEYVGITTGPLSRRVEQHLSVCARPSRRGALHHAILKYGAEAFTWEVVAQAETKQELLSLEIAMIAARGTLSPGGYNLTSGGEGLINPSPETRARISASQSTRRHPPEVRAKLAIISAGRKASPETLRKISVAHKGKTISQEHRERLRIANTGKRHTEASCAKMSAQRRGNQNGRAGWEKKARTVVVQGTSYPSIHAASRALSVGHKTLEYRIKQGFPGHAFG